MTQDLNPILKEDVYYQLRSPSLLLSVADSDAVCLLARGNYVLCIGLTTIDGARFAILLYNNEATGDEKRLLNRVSSFGRGKGEWRELNPMMVVALADVLPVL